MVTSKPSIIAYLQLTNSFESSGVRRKFSWGVGSFSSIWWSFVFGVCCLWRHILTSYSCFRTTF